MDNHCARKQTCGETLTKRLIKPGEQDSDSERSERQVRRSNQKTYFSKRFVLPSHFLVTELLPLLLLLTIPLSVHAGFFSSLAHLFSTNAVASAPVETIDTSAHATPLLSTAQNPDTGATGGGDIVVDGDALIPSGPVSKDDIAASPINSGEISIYTVDEGDTISQIAQMYGVTTNTIVWANDLSGPTDIHEGDALVILPIVGVQHKIAKGETLAGIVKKFDGNLDEVIKYNQLASADDITVGEEIMIPGGSVHEASTPTTRRVTRPTPTKSTGKLANTSGYFTFPVPSGAIITQGIHGYNGVDLAWKTGTPVVAAASGQVIVSKFNNAWNGGYGNYIVIKHNNGTQTLYAHLSNDVVKIGQWVSQGQRIGNIGSTGRSTGPHLHFEVRGGVNPFGKFAVNSKLY